MDLAPYVEHLRRDLLAAADGAGEEARQVVERLAFAIEPAARLALMEAVSQAAAEITAEMPAGGVDVRLSGRDLDFLVDVAPPTAAAPPAQPAPATADEAEDDGTVARVTLRIPESLKARAEELAASSGHSLNTWLVNVGRHATREGAVTVDIDLSSIPFGGNEPFGGRSGGRRMTGWI